MADIFLYPGEPIPSDVRLRDLTGQSVALTGQQIQGYTGLVKPDWHIESQQGTAVANIDVALVGQAITSAAGIVTPESSSPDVTVPLTGSASTSALGTLVPSSDVRAVGSAATSAAGSVVPSLDVAASGLSATLAAGILLPASDVPLIGAVSTSAAGIVTPSISSDLTLALTGQEIVGATGTLGTDGGTPVDTGDDLWLMRRRKAIFWKNTSTVPKKKRDKYKKLEI